MGYCFRNNGAIIIVMNEASKFTSSKLAQEIVRVFGSRAKTFKVEIKHQREVGDFVRKIEAAHKRAENSKLVFRA
jgi:HPt (histidine-containing phosphotransfer) domain-containing protein